MPEQLAKGNPAESEESRFEDRDTAHITFESDDEEEEEEEVKAEMPRRLVWDESDHPREPDGKFGEGGGGEGGVGKEEGGGDDRGRHDRAQQPFDKIGPANLWGMKNVVTEGGLSSQEQAALATYQSANGHQFINGPLRAGKPGAYEKDRKDIDAAMARSAVKEDVVVRRGMNFEGAAEQFVAGRTYHDRGFVSTTIHAPTAENFAANSYGTVAEILVPAGSRGIYLRGANEAEILLDRNASFRVHEVRQDRKSGRTTVRMTLLRQGGKALTARPSGRRLGAEEAPAGETATDPDRFLWGADDLVEEDDADA